MARVLIVEDEKQLNEAYQLILKKEGYDVDAALNGSEALEKVEEHFPDVILLDLRMPKMDGLQFLNKFNAKNNAADTSIIIFSNYDEQKEIEEAFRKGASRYILKAWLSPKELVKVVKETLEPEKKA